LGILRPVRNMVENVFFHQGLDFSFFGIKLPGCNDCNCLFSIKPADLFAAGIIHSKNPSVEFMGMFFLLNGSDGLYGLIKWQVCLLLARHL